MNDDFRNGRIYLSAYEDDDEPPMPVHVRKL